MLRRGMAVVDCKSDLQSRFEAVAAAAPGSSRWSDDEPAALCAAYSMQTTVAIQGHCRFTAAHAAAGLIAVQAMSHPLDQLLRCNLAELGRN